MKSGETYKLTIKGVRLHREERKAQGDLYGIYTSNYVANFNEYPNGIAVVDKLAGDMHPDWERKTDKRAKQLSNELTHKEVSVRIKDVFPGEDVFEGVIL